MNKFSLFFISKTYFFPFLLPEEDSRKLENQEIALFLILLAEAVILGSALLLWVFLPPNKHWVRRSSGKETAQTSPSFQ